MQNDTQPQLPSQLQENVVNTELEKSPVSSKPIQKKRSTLAITTAFLAGALVYAIFAAGYNLYLNNLERESLGLNVSDQTQSPQVPASSYNDPTASVKEEDLNSYVTAEDCTQKTEYKSLQQVFTLGKIQTIDLYDGIGAIVRNENTSRTYTVQWKTLPKIVDYQCKSIKITDLSANDRLNVYADANTSVSSNGYVQTPALLQKANK